MSTSLRSVGKPVIEWPEHKRRAALLVAERRLRYDQIAAEVGVHRETLWGWRQEGPFAGEVSRLRDQMDAEVWDLPIADRTGRLVALQDQYDALLVQWQATNSPIVGRLLLDTLKQAAIEAGQWNPRQDVRLTLDTSSTPMIREVVYGDIEDRIREEEAKIEREMEEGVAPGVGDTVDAEWRPAPALPRLGPAVTNPQRTTASEGGTEPKTEDTDDGWYQEPR